MKYILVTSLILAVVALSSARPQDDAAAGGGAGGADAGGPDAGGGGGPPGTQNGQEAQAPPVNEKPAQAEAPVYVPLADAMPTGAPMTKPPPTGAASDCDDDTDATTKSGGGKNDETTKAADSDAPSEKPSSAESLKRSTAGIIGVFLLSSVVASVLNL